MLRRLFGTDGVRGVANQEPMTAETALKLGRAVGHLARPASGKRSAILLGKDTRLSCYMLETALSAGICSMGVDVLVAGVIPTPGVAFLTKSIECNAGAVISASHNPFQDNGIKFFAGDGFKLSDELEEKVEELMFSNSLDQVRASPENVGRVSRIEDSVARYAVFLKNGFPCHMSLQGLSVVLDCANGAAYKAAPLVFEELGARVTFLGVRPDGLNINDRCGSLHPEQMCAEVRQQGADLGVALDGDGDRVILADEHGNEVNGDQVMGLIAAHMLQRGELAKNTLVATVMSNLGLEIAMRDMGGALVRTPVGDRYVVERMRQDGYNFGGEQSGHLIFLDRSTSGDGILSALQVMSVMLETGKPLSELAARVRKYPQMLRNVDVLVKKDLDEVPEVTKVIKECTDRLRNRGRLLVRYSGTQSMCRVMAEGENEDEVRLVVNMVADAIQRNL
jgi:phosphoglucosamine mutase